MGFSERSIRICLVLAAVGVFAVAGSGPAGEQLSTVPPPSPQSFIVQQPVEGTADLVNRPAMPVVPAMPALPAMPVAAAPGVSIPPESMPAIQYTYSGQSVQPTFDPTLNAYVMPPVVARVPMYRNPDGSLVPAEGQVVVPVPAPLGTPPGATVRYMTPSGPGAPMVIPSAPVSPALPVATADSARTPTDSGIANMPPSPFAPVTPAGTSLQGQVVGYLVPPNAIGNPPFGPNGPVVSESLPPQPGMTEFDQYCANCPAPVTASMTPYGAVGSAPDFRPELVMSSPVPLAITPNDAWRFMNSGERLIVLDVRGELERAIDGHILGDATLSYEPKETFAARVVQAIPDRNAPVILYCQSGITSATAAEIMSKAGFTRVFVLGPFANWPYARSN